MSERFYKVVRYLGTRIFLNASAPRVLHAERAARPGAYLLAANHTSAYDAPLLIASHPRMIRWISIAEAFRHPFMNWFLRGVGAEPLQRGSVDTRTMRVIVRHLQQGTVVGIFPEGQFREGWESVLAGGRIQDGVCKLAHLAQVPVLPAVVVGSAKFNRWTAWLPGARTRWAIAFGEAIFPARKKDRGESYAAMQGEIETAMRALHLEIADYA